jgi:hypothetical protein
VLIRGSSSFINSSIKRLASCFFGDPPFSNAYTNTLVSTKLTSPTLMQIVAGPIPRSDFDQPYLHGLFQSNPRWIPPAGVVHQPCQELAD